MATPAPPDPPHRLRVTVRFAPAPHAMVMRGAQAAGGISLAEYVREAALMRAAWELGVQHGRDPHGLAQWAAALRALTAELARQRQGSRQQ